MNDIIRSIEEAELKSEIAELKVEISNLENENKKIRIYAQIQLCNLILKEFK